jgi:hypothetical protein
MELDKDELRAIESEVEFGILPETWETKTIRKLVAHIHIRSMEAEDDPNVQHEAVTVDGY